jgi:hypothetical protein
MSESKPPASGGGAAPGQPCRRCESKGRTSVWSSVVEGRIHCAGCGTTIDFVTGDPVPRFLHDVEAQVRARIFQVQYPGIFHLGVPLSILLDDAWFAPVCGRFNMCPSS